MLRFLFRVLLLVCLVGPFVFVWAAFEKEPGLPPTATLDPQMAVKARGFATRVRTALREPGDADGKVRIDATQAELDSAIATAARIVRPLRGLTVISADGLQVAMSGQIPGLPDLGWINFSALIAPSGTGLDVQRLRLGRMNLPPALTVSVVRTALDFATPEALGSLLLDSVAGLEMEPGRVALALQAGTADGMSMFERAAASVRGLVGLGDQKETAAHFAAMSAAARAGLLPATGSSLPWIRFAVERAAEAGHETQADARNDVRAAILALAAHCGDLRAVQTLTGALTDDAGLSPCLGTGLRGRRDLRQHFTLSAALVVAGGSGFSFGLGEVKELVDAGKKTGSGYSFDDIAMDRAGIRFAETVLATPPGALAALLATMTSEDAIAPVVDDLPSLMSESTFVARFGGVDTPAYKSQIAEIDARIDALAIHSR
jgi:hypothetical protein